MHHFATSAGVTMSEQMFEGVALRQNVEGHWLRSGDVAYPVDHVPRPLPHSRADVVVHRGVAHWVEVAEDMSLDARGQITQVLAQIDATLQTIRSDRTRLLQVLVYIADEIDGEILDELWDAWVPAGHPPVRAMVLVGLGKTCKVEMVVTAAVLEG